jgi:hypothetical protein
MSKPNSAAPLSLDSLTEAATLLVEHGCRDEATRLVDEAIPHLEDQRALLLLARLHLATGRPADAEVALAPLSFWRLTNPWDVEGLVLYRLALLALGRTAAIAKLDRELSWMLSGPAKPAPPWTFRHSA